MKIVARRLLLITAMIMWTMTGSPGSLSAQSANGSVGGTIVDETSAALPGVTITLSSPALPLSA